MYPGAGDHCRLASPQACNTRVPYCSHTRARHRGRSMVEGPGFGVRPILNPSSALWGPFPGKAAHLSRPLSPHLSCGEPASSSGPPTEAIVSKANCGALCTCYGPCICLGPRLPWRKWRWVLPPPQLPHRSPAGLFVVGAPLLETSQGSGVRRYAGGRGWPSGRPLVSALYSH